MLTQRIRWHEETDLIVVGYGCAGAVAALTAYDAGMEALILEKQESDNHITNSYMSAGAFISPSNAKQAEQYMRYLCRVSTNLYWTPPDVIHIWAKYAVENKKWMENIGAHTELDIHGGEHNVPGTESMDTYQVRGMGPRMMSLLSEQIKNRGIRVFYGASAEELLTNSRGEVIGVKVRQRNPEKSINIRSRRAVVLATGGFEFNEEMKLNYLKVYPTYFTGSPANTGDGIRMALTIGAELWHMNCCSATLAMKFPGIAPALPPQYLGKLWRLPGSSVLPGFAGQGWGTNIAERLATLPGFIIADRYGKRYFNEVFKRHTAYYELANFDSNKLLYPRAPSYWIFDRKRLQDSPLAPGSLGATGPSGFYKWSSDNSAEIARGWIKQGDSIKKLATKLGMEPQTLKDTINTYNHYCKQKLDMEFGRIPESLVPLENPPYYAVELWPGGPNTQGGPRRNAKSQILRPGGSVIPRLYSAGELGSIYGMLYPMGGGNLAECIVFGRIAGEQANKERPA
ncbi:MAG: FAD-binding protein [Chloroflexota bacterium]